MIACQFYAWTNRMTVFHYWKLYSGELKYSSRLNLWEKSCIIQLINSHILYPMVDYSNWTTVSRYCIRFPISEFHIIYFRNRLETSKFLIITRPFLLRNLKSIDLRKYLWPVLRKKVEWFDPIRALWAKTKN